MLWYVETLGMHLVLDDPEHQYALLEAGGGRLALEGVRLAWNRSGRQVRLVFQVPDVEAERVRLMAQGVGDVSPPCRRPERGLSRGPARRPRGDADPPVLSDSPEDDARRGCPNRHGGIPEARMRFALVRTTVLAMSAIASSTPGGPGPGSSATIENVSSPRRGRPRRSGRGSTCRPASRSSSSPPSRTSTSR